MKKMRVRAIVLVALLESSLAAGHTQISASAHGKCSSANVAACAMHDKYLIQRTGTMHKNGRDVTDLVPPSAGCGRIFIDLGANVGDTITRFVHADPGILPVDGTWAVSKELRPWNPQFPSIVEPSARHWPNFDYRVYDFTLMRILNTTNSMPKEYCLVGVDANPYWKPHYDLLEKYLSKDLQVHGLPRAEMHSGLAAGLDVPRVLNFACTKFHTSDLKTYRSMDPAGDHLAGDPANVEEDMTKETCMVPTFDVEAYIHDMAVSTSPPTTIILKVDLEGAEVNILKRLIKNRTFCKFPRGTDIHLIAHEMSKFRVDRSPAREFPCGVRIYTVHPGQPCGNFGEPDSASESCFDGHGWPWALPP